MDLEAELLQPPSVPRTDRLTNFVCHSKTHFNHLMDLFFDSHYRLGQRATLIILSCAKQRPQWLAEQVPRMVHTLREELPVALKRNILRILQYQALPESCWGHAANQCFLYLSSPAEPVAVKAFSMTILYNLSKDVPELGRELKLVVEELYPLGSPGIKARGRRVLKQLAKDGY